MKKIISFNTVRTTHKTVRICSVGGDLFKTEED